MLKKIVLITTVCIMAAGCSNTKKTETKHAEKIVEMNVVTQSGVTAELKDDNILVKAGNIVITKDEYEEALTAIPKDSLEYYKTEKGKDEIVKSLLTVKLMAEEAKNQNIDKEKEFIKIRDLAVEKELANYFVKINFMDKISSVTNEELSAEYEKKKSDFAVPATVRAYHILIKADSTMSDAERVNAKKQAQTILDKLLVSPADFEKLAKENSSCPSNVNGGDLGYFGKGEMVQEFEDAAFAGEVGKIIPHLVETQFGYHIIKVVDKKDAGFKNLTDVQEQLKEEILMEKRYNSYKKYIEDLEKKYNIKLQ